jgi:ABC-type multidrug transport system ATPase subunit
MDEAEELCDRIGIMDRGRMLCLGTSEYLKARFSIGYQLTFQLELCDSESDDADLFENYLMVVLHNSLLGKISGETIFRLSYISEKSLGLIHNFQIQMESSVQESSDSGFKLFFLRRLFEQLSAAKLCKKRLTLDPKMMTAIGLSVDHRNVAIIKQWGIGRTSLEDVFLEVVKQNRRNISS